VIHNILLTRIVWDAGGELSTPGITAIVAVHDEAPPPRWESAVDEARRTGLVLTAAQRRRLRASAMLLTQVQLAYESTRPFEERLEVHHRLALHAPTMCVAVRRWPGDILL